MTPMAAVAAVCGALIAGGVVLTTAGVVGTRHPPPARPASRWRRLATRLDAPTRRWAAAAVGVALVVLAVTRWPVAALAAAVATVALPRVLSRRAATRRIERLEGLEQWSRRLADVLTAARGLEDALIRSADSAPAPIAAEVQALARRLRMRTTAERALRAFADDLDDPVGDLIAAALILAASRGSGAAGVLTGLARTVSKEVANRREVEAEQARHRTTVRWVVVMLAGYSVFVTVRQSYSAPFDTLVGQLVLALVAALYGAGLWWVHRLGIQAPAGRFLTTTARRDPASEGVGS